MFKVVMITDDNNYANKLMDFWNRHCGNEIELITKNEWDNNEELPDLIICDENKSLSNINCKTLTLVSEFDKQDNPWRYPKYCKPKELYNKVLSTCSMLENNLYDSILKPIKIGNEKLLEYKLEQNNIDEYTLEVMKKCPIEGLISLHIENEKNEEIYYYIHGKISLKEFFCKNESAKKLLYIFNDIIDILNKLDEYMLDRNNVVLDIDHVFIHQITGKPSLILLPGGVNKGCSWEKSFHKLIKDLMRVPTIDRENEKYIDIKLSDDKSDKLILKEKLSYNDRTEFFQSMQKAPSTKNYERKNARLKWNRTNEFIEVDRKIFKIGKEEKYVDLCIKNNLAVSRNHADILLQEGTAFIVDKASLNHTFVNGEELVPNKRVELHNEDKIQIANESFVFYI